MITIEMTEVTGWEAAIRGMRNPLNSWAKSDSHLSADFLEDHLYIGKNDFDLMKKLIKSGTDHAKFMRMIIVTCDITAPLYWWKEFDTYKVGTVRNSCSTMHKIHAKEFTLGDFSHEHLYHETEEVLRSLISWLNECRRLYVETGVKQDWWNLIQLLPESYNQRSTVQMNYAVLRNMYHSRHNHKLDEWRDFCKWVESLPYSKLITDKEVE